MGLDSITWGADVFNTTGSKYVIIKQEDGRMKGSSINARAYSKQNILKGQEQI